MGDMVLRLSRAFVAICAVAGLAVLAGCSGPTPLCEAAAPLIEQGQLAQATELYARAEVQGEGGCATAGLTTAGERYRDAAREATRGAGLERAGDTAGAIAAYESALAIDAGNTAAATGLSRLGQGAPQQPVPLPLESAAPAPQPGSWWSQAWPLVAGGIGLILLAAAGVAWFAVRRDRSARTAFDGTVRDQLKDLRADAAKAGEDADRRTVERLFAFQRRIRAQQAEIVQLQRVLDRSLRTAPAIRYFAGIEQAGDAAGARTGGTAEPAGLAVGVTLEVLAVADAGAAGDAAAGEPEYRVAIRRVLDDSAPEGRWSPEDAPDDQIDARAAARTFYSEWTWVEELWVSPARPGQGWLAVDLDGLGASWLTLLCGLPPDAAGSGPSLEAPVERLGERIRAALDERDGLAGPQDGQEPAWPDGEVRTLVRVQGIVVGLGRNAPVLTNARLESGPPGVLALAAAESIEQALGHELAALGGPPALTT